MSELVTLLLVGMAASLRTSFPLNHLTPNHSPHRLEDYKDAVLFLLMLFLVVVLIV
jgi:hypothetical protein